MTTLERCPAPSPSAPAWAVRVAHLIPLLTLPSALWRFPLAFGFPAGYTDAGYDALMAGPWAAFYVITLSVLTEALALLSLGLVRPWGRVLPRRIPVFGGRRLRPRAVTAAALAGALGLAVLWTPMLWWWSMPHDDMTPTGHVVVGLFYLPMVAWGPLLAVLAVAYHRRNAPRAA